MIKRLPTLGLCALLALFLGVSAYARELTPVPNPAGEPSLAPRLVPLDDTRAVLTWLERRDEGHRFSYAVFDDGAFGPAGVISEGSRFFANWADTPGVLTLPDGAWLAWWLERSGSGPYAYDIRASVSRDEGSNWSPPFSPHRDGTLTEHGFVSGWSAGASRAGLVWLDGRETKPAAVDRSGDHDGHAAGGAMTLRTALVGPDGSLHDEALLDQRVCDCCATATAVAGDGPVIAYRDRSEGEIRDIKLIRRTATGWSEPVTVHEDGWHIAACPVNGPAILARGSTVLVAWFTMAGDQPSVRLARSLDGGRTFEAPLVLDADRALGRVDLAWAGEGFVLTWLSQDDGAGVLRLARFDGQAEMLEQHELLSVDGGRISGFPKMLSLPGGRLLLAWTAATAESRQPRIETALIDGGIVPTLAED